MGIEAAITIVVGAIASIGAFLEGRRRGKSQNIQDDVGTVELLKAAIAELERQNQVKDVLITDLTARLGVLESLITQRADVAAVEAEVKEMRIIVDRIAEAVDA